VTARTTLVVGASGRLGGAVTAHLRDAGHRVAGTYCSTPVLWADVQFDFWTDDLRPLLSEYGADAVVFAASPEYGGELDTGRTSVTSTFEERAHAVVEACRDCRLVYVSSAAVFDGDDGGYVESDDSSPPDDYGRRLVAFEDSVRELSPDHVCLRTSYQFGVSRGALDPRLERTRRAVETGTPVTYFADMYKSPVAVTDVAAAVASLVAGDATGVLHVPAPRTSVYDFHRDAMAALGYNADLIEAGSIPEWEDVACDRSLSSERFEQVVPVEVQSVHDALRGVDADSVTGPA